MKKSLSIIGISTLLVLMIASIVSAEIRWYIAPFDVMLEGGDLTRTPGISRYIPTVPNPQGADFDEAEILGNHIVVKVNAPTALQDVIQADPDFVVIPATAATIPTADRAAIRAKLLALGYILKEINDANWLTANLFRLLTSAVHQIIPSADGLSLVNTGIRKGPSKTVDDINRRLPG